MKIELQKKEGTWKEDDFPFFRSHHKKILVDGRLYRWKTTTKVDNKCIIDLEELIEFFCKKDNKTYYEYELEHCWRITQGRTVKECQGCKLYSGN